MRDLKDRQLSSAKVAALETEIHEARGYQSSLKKYIDTRGYVDFKPYDANWTGSVIYVPINGGTAFIMGVYVTYEGIIDYNIPFPIANTTYYLFLNQNATITHSIDPTESDTNMIIGSVTTGFTVDEVTTKDLRQILRKDGVWEEIQLAKNVYPTLKEYIDTKGFSDFQLEQPIFTGSYIRVPIKAGRVEILGNTIVRPKQYFEMISPVPDNTYYFFMNKDGTILYRLDPIEESVDEIILGTVRIGMTLDDISVTDLRRTYVKDGTHEEVVASRGDKASLNERLADNFNFLNTRAALIQIKEHLLAGVTKTVQGVIPNNFEIVKVFLRTDNEPAGADLILDINKNGTSLFTDQTKRPRILDGQFTGECEDFDDTEFLEGDLLSIDIDQVGTVKPGGKDLMITIKFIMKE